MTAGKIEEVALDLLVLVKYTAVARRIHATIIRTKNILD